MGFLWHIREPPDHAPQRVCLKQASFLFADQSIGGFHRFSHGTMPIFNLFRNCGYYWAAGAYISWCINHPLYTAPPIANTIICLTLAMTAEFANAK